MTDLAIVGISCIFPGADNYNTFWENLISKKSSISEVPKSRWSWEDYDGKIFEENKTNSRWGGFIDNIDKFDNDFFSISKMEAERMDPQQRLFLEQVWSCLEDSGYDPQKLSGSKTGVFAGVSTSDYHSLFIRSNTPTEAFSVSGLASSLLANRVSYFFNFRGPSQPIDTACSSSLVALNLAVDSINNGHCDSAIVGGVNIMMSPEQHLSFGKAGMLSSTGACKTFDADADGYVRGEGCGVVYIKKLKDAVEANDNIYCVVKGSAVNHGGKVYNVTSPNPYAQAQVITDGLIRAGVSPDKVSYIEAHGTGTPLGDPIEILGLKKAFTNLSKHFGVKFKDAPHCGLGTVKTNIGHLEAAAGIAGIIKTALCLKNNKLPALQNFKSQNPKIKLKGSPFYLLKDVEEWNPDNSKEGTNLRTAGVSSFGFGGANAFVVLQEYRNAIEKHAVENADASEFLFPYSGKEEDNLIQIMKVHKSYIENELSDEYLADYAYTLQSGRTHFQCRYAFISSNKANLLTQIKSYLENPGSFSNDNEDKRTNDWINGGDMIWETDDRCRKISIPTYQFTGTSLWLDLSNIAKSEPVEDEAPRNNIRTQITLSDLEAVWNKAIAGEEFEPSADLTELDSLSLIGLSLSIQKKYEITLDWSLLTDTINTPEKIVGYINSHLADTSEPVPEEDSTGYRSDTFDEMTDLLSICKPERWFYPKEKNKLPICFIVTSMRHGSSLTSFILNANPGIYAPQGLYLLPFTNLQERAEVLKKQILFLEEGLINTVEDLWNLDKAEAKKLIEQWTDERLPVADIYMKIQEKCYPRLLVDRGTIYGLDINILERARKSFENVKFIHLLRHPSSVFRSGTSLLKKTALMKRLISQEDFNNPVLDKKIQSFLDRMWADTHINFYDFNKTLDSGSSYQLKFENLVGDSSSEIAKLCDFLDVPFSDKMLNPYDDEDNVKLHNKKGESGISSIDPKVMSRTQIESKNSDNWKKFIPKWPISIETKYFMGKYSYEFIESNKISDELVESVNEACSDEKILVIPGFGGKLDSFKRIFSGTDFTVDGLKIPEYAPFNSIQNLADFFVEKVDALSRYDVIIGYSLGALVAWELAHRLSEDKCNLKKLILIDRNPNTPKEELYVKNLEEIRNNISEKYRDDAYMTDVIEGLINYGILFLNFDGQACSNNINSLLKVEQEKTVLIEAFVSGNKSSVLIEGELNKFVSLFQLTRKMLKNYSPSTGNGIPDEAVYFQPDKTDKNPLPNNMKRIVVDDCDHFSIINREKIKDLLLDQIR